MSIYEDFRVYSNGDIRYLGNGNTYKVKELYRFLNDLSNDNRYSLNILSLNVAMITPDIMRLLNDYNIDDETSNFLYDGCIVQGEYKYEEMYNGIKVIGTVAYPETSIGIIQDGKCVKYKQSGYNGSPSEGILMRCLIKTKVNGQLIDDGKLIVRARHPISTSSEFKIMIGGIGTYVAAIHTMQDLHYDGNISEVRVWDGVLPTETIENLFKEEIEYITLDDVLI